MSIARPFRRGLGAAATAGVLSVALAACGSSSASDDAAAGASPSTASGTTSVAIATAAGQQYKLTRISVPVVASIRQELPAAILKSGELTIGEGALPSGFPPLAYVGTDNKTFTGAEPDLGRLIAAVLGLKPVINNSTWDNLFVGIDSGKNDVGFSNITVTEERKQKYDFASYRQDNLALAVKKGTTWTFDRNDPRGYEVLAGKKVAVGSGTNQEKILLHWRDLLKKEGKTLEVKYFADDTSAWTALASGQIDAYFGPNPGIAYQESITKGTPKEVATAGTYSGAGASLQGLIAATTKKGDGLVQPLADAIDYLIKNGQYAAWLAAYNLSNEAVTSAQVNPAGLPLSNS
ncbi:transporter substrate-binding domain-containing protein [Nocardioides sp. BP30]|uniref:transporter substrate-binding domain-containing protein n=1 Tax=Nocardioides sp. BP30 TaxID=3036374 RepID=UPI00246831E9|nr:transporter substrate-binding domain-containing protein [Nocardioides sp. BP30]WGL52710.1 transporter substrate-binding domain-containing protein [Nocardioides sp. BP30]